jgi:hypothetical protein
MKLYTEEQVRELVRNTYCGNFYDNNTPDDLVNELTPIELPSDEEMKKILDSRSDEYASGYYGAINMIEEQIKQQKMDELYWRTENPPKEGQYIINIGAEGLSWGWWDGKVWNKYWHKKPIDIVGWLPTPLYKEENNEQG